MKASGYDRAIHDWYQEPAWIVDALLDAEPLRGASWDPSCGEGTIPKTLIARGLPCLGSDITDRGYGTVNHDFFTSTFMADNIVSNPPYGVIEPYIRKALDVTARKVILLARLALLESTKRKTLFETTPLARVLVSRRRISMPPGGEGIKATGGTIAFAWFVWEHGHEGPPTVGWV